MTRQTRGPIRRVVTGHADATGQAVVTEASAAVVHGKLLPEPHP